MADETFEFVGNVYDETDDAYLIFDGDREVWIAKSQVEDMQTIVDRTGLFEFTIPEWLAKEKELI